MKGYTYPRTLHEAFNDAERSFAIHGPYRGDSIGWVVSVWASCVITATVVVAILVGVL